MMSKAGYSTASATSSEPVIHPIFEKVTGTWQYIVADPLTLCAIIIDSVLDYDPITQAISTTAADSLLCLVKENGYTIERILETHAHADHLTAAFYIQQRLLKETGQRPPVGIGKRIVQVQELFGKTYGVPKDEYQGVFDDLIDDDETFGFGQIMATALHLPGHTPDHMGYKIGDNIFCGDSIFHADIGTARCDFPGGSATDLYTSGRKLLELPGHIKIWTGHDYPSNGRKDPSPWMSVEQHRNENKHLRDGVTEEEFVNLRQARDGALAAPRLLHQSLQVNIRAGRPPKPTASGKRMLHLPLKLGDSEWNDAN